MAHYNAVDVLDNEFSVVRVDESLKGSARRREISERCRLNSADGRILDEHDQFYRDHKLLLKLFQILGVMPIERGEIGRITFSWVSSAAIYAYCFYFITSVLVVLVGYERVTILTMKSKRFDEYIYSIIFVVYLVPHFFTPIVGWSVARDVCDYKNGWGYFQLNYFRITGKSLEFPHLNTLIAMISSGCLVVAVAFLLSLSALLAGFTLYHTSAYVHIITMINMNCALWYINCRAIGDASKSVADSFEKDVDKLCAAYIIAHYRLLWLDLSNLLQKLGNTYARTYTVYCLFMLTNITIAVYGFMSEIMDHGFGFSFKEMGLLVDAFYCLTLLYIFCDCSHQASRNIANRVQDTLMNIDKSTVEPGTSKEIELFLTAIQMNPPKVSLQGYAIVNRELITSSLTTMAIYLIVLLQFKISLIKEAKTTPFDAFGNSTLH